ncbi:MAG: AraC family transcriptional regulator [Bacillota bacterium]|nr:AraC family transcriptional regulator [Bacillota bacterium]
MFRHLFTRFSLFKRLLISNLLMIFVIVSISFALYALILANEIDNTIESNQQILVKTRENIDNKLNDINNQILELTLNSQIFELMNYRVNLDGSDLSKLKSYMKALPRLTLGNEYIKAYYLYSSKNNLLIMPSAVYTRMNLYYDPLFLFGDLNYDEWLVSVLDVFCYGKFLISQNVMINGQISKCVPYIYTFAGASGINSVGQFVFFIKESSLIDLMEQAHHSGAFYTSIIDDQNNTIVSSGNASWTEALSEHIRSSQQFTSYEEIDIDGERLIVVQSKSGKYGYAVLSVIPYHAIVQSDNVRYTKLLLLSAVLIMLLIGIVLSYVMAASSSKPLHNIIKNHQISLEDQQHRENTNEISLIDQTLTKMKNRQTDLLHDIDTQRNWAKDIVFSQIVDGSISQQPDVDRTLATLGIELDFDYCHGVAMTYRSFLRQSDTMTESFNCHLYLEEVLNDMTDIIPFHKRATQDTLLLLFLTNKNDDIKEFFNSFYMQMLNQYGTEVHVFIGCGETSLCDVDRSFIEAKHLCLSADRSGGQHVFITERQADECSVNLFMPEQSRRLIDLCISGNQDNAIKELDQIWNRITKKQIQTKLSLQVITSDIVSTMHKVLGCIPGDVPDELQRFVDEGAETQLRELSLHHVFDYARACIIQFSNHIKENQSNQNIQKINQIKCHIDTNYSDMNMSLQSVSSYFNMTEHYLSDFFKKQTGDNFSSYIERTRINHAQEMLEQGMSINDIASQVGYMNVNTFRRAYRRRIGHNPNIDKKDN